ncbi:MAG: hypothetical protein C0448_16005, partial [Sphingobacteriaceae bacterium]|nr:hypothetical protein [Sphingobacteriaceae bacterium]
IALIDKGADLFKKNKEGKTPLDLITDEAFRLSLPEQLEEISESKAKEDKLESKTEVVQQEVKKTGLSSIKKK